jgi:hypothetical protein
MTPDELRAHVEEEYKDEPEEEKRADQELLVLLDLWDPERDLEQTLIDMDSSQIAGFYDPDDDTFYVVTDEEGNLDLRDELTFVHEYVHALQDQYYDLSILDEEKGLNDDERMAFRALAEGEATQVSFKYLGERLTLLEQMTAIQQDFEDESETEQDVPSILENLRTFPYRGGLDFVEAVAPNGYWPAIDQAYKDQPASTEQIMHPEKYLDERDDPRTVQLPDGLSQLDAEWAEMDNDVMGEFFTREFLANHIAPDLAAIAAAGWDGDRYAFLENRKDGRDLLIWQTVWDSVEEAREFVTAQRAVFAEEQGYEQITRNLQGGDRTLRWGSDERQVYLRQDGDNTWLVIANHPPDLDLVIPLLHID